MFQCIAIDSESILKQHNTKKGPTGGSNGSKQACIKLAQGVQRIFRHVSAMLLVIIGSPGNVHKFNFKGSKRLRELLDYLDRCSNDLWTYAVTRNGCNMVGCSWGHGGGKQLVKTVS